MPCYTSNLLKGLENAGDHKVITRGQTGESTDRYLLSSNTGGGCELLKICMHEICKGEMVMFVAGACCSLKSQILCKTHAACMSKRTGNPCAKDTSLINACVV
jgi:hypothetical protein